MRKPVKGDIVILDYPELNAICRCDDMSDDQVFTQGIGVPGTYAYKMSYLVGLSLMNGVPEPCDGFIWLRWDPDAMSIVGVDGCTLPPMFYGVDCIDLFTRMGYTVTY